VRAKEGEANLAINPFSLEPDSRNLAFLTAWCCELAAIEAAYKPQIRAAIETLYHTQEIRNFAAFWSVLTQSAPDLAARFAPWNKGGEYAHLFTSQEDVFSAPQDWMGLDITEACSTAENAVAVFAYLLHRMVLLLDGQPTIIVVQHAFPLLQQPFFASRLESLLEMLRENNAMMIVCVRYGPSLADHAVMEQLMQACASTVVVPDDLPLDYATLLPALIDAEDQELLSGLARMQGDLMLKRGREAVALRINLENMPDVAAIFDNDIKTLISAGGPFATLPPGARGGHA
jgi:type IV secretory pathway VirB4 component